MKIELPQHVIEACARYSKMERSCTKCGQESLALLNKAAFIGEQVAALVAAEIVKLDVLIAERESIAKEWRAGNGDPTTVGYTLGALDQRINAIKKAQGL